MCEVGNAFKVALNSTYIYGKNLYKYVTYL